MPSLRMAARMLVMPHPRGKRIAQPANTEPTREATNGQPA
jgi:hypothetical protein